MTTMTIKNLENFIKLLAYGMQLELVVAIDLIVQHISEYLKRSPSDKPPLEYPGLSSSVPGSPQRGAKGGRPH